LGNPRAVGYCRAGAASGQRGAKDEAGWQTPWRLADSEPVTWLLDLDGVIWLSGEAIAGSTAAIERLRRSGHPVVFFTNNSWPTIAEQRAALADVGIEATADEILTSSQAAASLLDPGATAAVIGGPGVKEALANRGVEIVAATAQPVAVVVGRTTDLSFDELAVAADAIRQGAQFIATNTDATMPTPEGPQPGAGAIVAFLQVASGVEPLVAGKPAPAAAMLVAERVGAIEVSIGDRSDTDGLFAQETKSRFGLVLSGVTNAADLPVHPAPDFIGATLAEIVDQVLGPDSEKG
jgi:HAD superfamily hydrolase (TIGR01450 family)